MDAISFAMRLRSQAAAMAALLDGLDDESARWHPVPGSWSIVEIVNHLADEEDEDFRARLRLLLEGTGAAWPAIDPEGAVTARGHASKDLASSLQRFVDTRGESLAWLAGLEDVDWNASYEHPSLGRLTAGDLLSSWVAHDQLHLRQFVRRLYQLTTRDAAPYSLGYAGPFSYAKPNA